MVNLVECLSYEDNLMSERGAYNKTENSFSWEIAQHKYGWLEAISKKDGSKPRLSIIHHCVSRHIDPNVERVKQSEKSRRKHEFLEEEGSAYILRKCDAYENRGEERS